MGYVHENIGREGGRERVCPQSTHASATTRLGDLAHVKGSEPAG